MGAGTEGVVEVVVIEIAVEIETEVATGRVVTPEVVVVAAVAVATTKPL